MHRPHVPVSPAELPDLVEGLAERMVGHDPHPGLANALGIRISDAGRGWMRATMPLDDRTKNSFGTLHGGAAAALVDHLLGAVLYPSMAPGSWAATTSFTINLTKAVRTGPVEGTAVIVSRTRGAAVVRVEVHEGDALVAMAQGTITIKPPRD